MGRRLPLAWLQLNKQKPRLIVAVAGVAFAVVLVSMQLGFRSSMYESAVRLHRTLIYDLVLINPKMAFIGLPESFTRRRLYQALAVPGVRDVTPVYMRQGYWENPWTFASRGILVLGIDPSHDAFAVPAVNLLRDRLRIPDQVLFDAHSRPEFGPVAQHLASGATLQTEVNNRRVNVVGLFELGTSFGIDGILMTSDLNYLRIFWDRPVGLIELGLVHLEARVDVQRVQAGLRSLLERDVEILTRDEFIAREVEYWASTTPIGFVFGFGAIMGLIVGGVIVYQILYADVSEHLKEYATLKAVGFHNRDLSRVVLNEAWLLAMLGFVPGMVAVYVLYDITAEATRLPLAMTAGRFAAIFALTLGMCMLSGILALRRVRAADPAEVFG